MNLHRVGVSRNERLAPEGEAPQPKSDPFMPKPDLPLGQKMVLLKLRKGELAAAILEKLKAMSAPEPSGADWRACIEANYIRRSFAHSRTGRLELCPPGLSAVGAVMRDLAPKYNIHLFTRSGGLGSGIKTACSCGWASTYCRDSRAGESKINSLQSAHIGDVESGAWGKREQKLTAFLNEVSPPQFQFNASRGPAHGPSE